MHTLSKPARPGEWPGWKSLWEVLSFIGDERIRKEIYDSLLKNPPTENDPVVVISAYYPQALRAHQIPLGPVPAAVFNNPVAFDAYTVDEAKAQLSQAFHQAGAQDLEGHGVAFRFVTRDQQDMARLRMTDVAQQNNINWAFYMHTGPTRQPNAASPPTIDAFLINEVKDGRDSRAVTQC